MNHTSKTLTAFAILALSVFALAKADILLNATLAGKGTGKAKWKASSTKKEAEFQLESTGLAKNAAYAVTIGGDPIGMAKSDAFGNLRVTASFRGTVPTVEAGEEVDVIAASGAIAQSGILK